MTKKEMYDFVKESNSIERIYRDPLPHELEEFERFFHLETMSIEELQRFVSVYQPNAKIRDKYGMNVQINSPAGRYLPPLGGPTIIPALQKMLDEEYNPFVLHIRYEKLHPFEDGNGRSGRALWAWKRKSITGGFLMNFYFETLRYTR